MKFRLVSGVMMIIVSALLIAGINFSVIRAVDYGSLGTTVGGIIWENTTWTLENSPYTLTDTVQIPVNVTLTIEPGVTIMRPTSGDMFLLHGTLFAHGTINEKIVFDGGGNSEFFTTWGGEGNAFLDFCIIRNGYRFWNRGGYFNLTRSELNNLTDEILLESPSADICIEYNKFVKTGGLNAHQAAGRTCKISVRYNLFQNISSPINNAGGSPGQNEMIVKRNSFISIDEIILSLALDFDTAIMNATENYWGTLDTDLIDSKIYDRNDDIRIKNYIDYLPILSEPHFDTPKISSTIYVDDDNTAGPWDGTVEHPYQNITQGLNHASEGDTIFVKKGTYYEHVTINKSISLIGENRSTTIIDGNETGTIVTITRGNVSISGFTIQNGGFDQSSIYISSSSDVTINDNAISNNFEGIHLNSSNGNDIADNLISPYAAVGIFLNYSNGNVIRGNIINPEIGLDQIGILLTHSTENSIINNTILNNLYDGIKLIWDANANVISGNNIKDNGYGVLMVHSGNNTLYHNNFINNGVSCDDANTWDNGYPSGGNYWSDYEERYPNATEIDDSGLWDTPYFIDESNQDNYPIIPEFSTWTSMLLVFTLLTVVIAIYKRRLLKTSIH